MIDNQSAAAAAGTEETKGPETKSETEATGKVNPEDLLGRSQIANDNAQHTEAAAIAVHKGTEPELATTKAPTEEDLTVTEGAFVPFRFWANMKIRNSARQVTLEYAGGNHNVTEITPDGKIRLELGQEARLIPFDERVIPEILEQLL